MANRVVGWVVVGAVVAVGAAGCANGSSTGTSSASAEGTVPAFYRSDSRSPSVDRLATALAAAGFHVRTEGGHVIVEATNQGHESDEGTLTVERGPVVGEPPKQGPLKLAIPCAQPSVVGLYADGVVVTYGPTYFDPSGSFGDCSSSTSDLSTRLRVALATVTPTASVSALPNNPVVDATVAQTTTS